MTPEQYESLYKDCKRPWYLNNSDDFIWRIAEQEMSIINALFFVKKTVSKLTQKMKIPKTTLNSQKNF